jgi:signal peptidase I
MRPKAVLSKLKRWVPDILFVVLLFAARSSLADHYYVPSGSMEYTLLPGDRVVVDKTAYGIEFPFTDIELFGGGRPTAGEVAVFDSPLDGRRLIKRIVAVGGDTVALRDGRMYLNGRALRCEDDIRLECFREREARLNLSYGAGPDIARLTVPEGQVLALGDARGNSTDGRVFGLIDEADLQGRAVAIYHRREGGFTWRRL